MMRPAFDEASPQAAAERLHAGVIHLWRIPYAPAQRRAPLVALLAAYLGVPVTEVVLDETVRGKPRLAPCAGDRGDTRKLEFNWSHSGDFALVALSRDGAVGVDIEHLGKDPRALEIARRFFDASEAEALASLDPAVRDDAFIALWCAKEAVLKAAGEGLSFGLARLAFRHAGGAWQLARADPALGACADWHLESFDPVPGYRGALAWRGGSRRITALRPRA